MFYFVTLFNVPAAAEEAFVRRLGRGGPWLEQVRRVTPALVGADLLRHQSWPVFLCQEIWTAPEGFAQACGSQTVRQLLDARKKMAASSFEIGGFLFPKLKETAGAGSTRLPLARFGRPAGWVSTARLEDELLNATVQATTENASATRAALARIDAYLAKGGNDSERQRRQSLLELLRLLRPSLAELLGEPSSL